MACASQISDATGTERFSLLIPNYLIFSTAMLLVADASDMGSVAELQRYYDMSQKCVSYRVAVVLNKIDRADPAVQQAVAQFAARYDLPVIALSALTMAGMDQLVAFIATLPTRDTPAVPSTVASPR